jgi:hypothetical protein
VLYIIFSYVVYNVYLYVLNYVMLGMFIIMCVIINYALNSMLLGLHIVSHAGHITDWY